MSDSPAGFGPNGSNSTPDGLIFTDGGYSANPTAPPQVPAAPVVPQYPAQQPYSQQQPYPPQQQMYPPQYPQYPQYPQQQQQQGYPPQYPYAPQIVYTAPLVPFKNANVWNILALCGIVVTPIVSIMTLGLLGWVVSLFTLGASITGTVLYFSSKQLPHSPEQQSKAKTLLITNWCIQIGLVLFQIFAVIMLFASIASSASGS